MMTQAATTRFYVWFDSGTPDASRHKQEIDLFTSEVASDALALVFNILITVPT
jgi:hypothetical protein